MHKWPVATMPPSCYAGKLSFRLDNKGRLYPCNEMVNEGINILEYDLDEALAKMKYSSCEECWCASQLEFNLIMDLNFDAIINAFMYVTR